MTFEQLSSYYKISVYVNALKNEIAVTKNNKQIPSDQVAKKETQLVSMIDFCIHERDALIEYVIGDVAKQDKLVAAMIYWRFVVGLSWTGVGARCHCKGNTCYRMVKRYIDRFG